MSGPAISPAPREPPARGSTRGVGETLLIVLLVIIGIALLFFGVCAFMTLGQLIH